MLEAVPHELAGRPAPGTGEISSRTVGVLLVIVTIVKLEHQVRFILVGVHSPRFSQDNLPVAGLNP